MFISLSMRSVSATLAHPGKSCIETAPPSGLLAQMVSKLRLSSEIFLQPVCKPVVDGQSRHLLLNQNSQRNSPRGQVSFFSGEGRMKKMDEALDGTIMVQSSK